MKKTKKSHAPRTNPPRPLDEPSLTAATGGADGDPVAPWTPEQHNEAIVHAGPRRRRARR